MQTDRTLCATHVSPYCKCRHTGHYPIGTAQNGGPMHFAGRQSRLLRTIVRHVRSDDVSSRPVGLQRLQVPAVWPRPRGHALSHAPRAGESRRRHEIRQGAPDAQAGIRTTNRQRPDVQQAYGAVLASLIRLYVTSQSQMQDGLHHVTRSITNFRILVYNNHHKNKT